MLKPYSASSFFLPNKNRVGVARGDGTNLEVVYIVREWLLWEVERERERERRLWRHWYHAEIASDQGYDYLDGALTLRVDAFWACRVLEVHAKTRSLALGALDKAAVKKNCTNSHKKILFCGCWCNFFFTAPLLDRQAGVEWLMKDDGEVEALRSLVRLPWITQQHFVGMLEARRIDQCDVYFIFEWHQFWPLTTAWIADILLQASMRDVERQRWWKRGSGDGQRLWDYFTARLSDISMQLTSEVRRSPEPSARPLAAADSEERQICTTCLFAESDGLCFFLPSCAMSKDNAVGNVVAETGRDLVFIITARLTDLSMPLKGEVRRSPEQSARQPIARSGKFVRHAYLRRALGCEKTTVLCFLPSWSTLLFERG